jgi:plasmid stability protein
VKRRDPIKIDYPRLIPFLQKTTPLTTITSGHNGSTYTYYESVNVLLSMPSMITMKSISQHMSGFMASITIRNLDENVKARLRIAAARHGCSMEEEVRRILRLTLMVEDKSGLLGTRIHKRFAELGGFELCDTDRSGPRTAPVFTSADE